MIDYSPRLVSSFGFRERSGDHGVAGSDRVPGCDLLFWQAVGTVGDDLVGMVSLPSTAQGWEEPRPLIRFLSGGGYILDGQLTFEVR